MACMPAFLRRQQGSVESLEGQQQCDSTEHASRWRGIKGQQISAYRGTYVSCWVHGRALKMDVHGREGLAVTVAVQPGLPACRNLQRNARAAVLASPKRCTPAIRRNSAPAYMHDMYPAGQGENGWLLAPCDAHEAARANTACTMPGNQSHETAAGIWQAHSLNGPK